MINPWNLVGRKVKLLTVIGRPKGTITRAAWLDPMAGSMNPDRYRMLFWVRLPDGVLLKDVTENEISFVGEPNGEEEK